MSGAHAKFSPSAAHRVVTCPASLALAQEAPRSTSWAATEGTIAHFIHALIAAGDVQRADAYIDTPPATFMNGEDMDADEWATVPDGWMPDREFVDFVQASADWCLDRAVGADATYVETKVDVSAFTPVEKQFGTCDFAAVFRDGRLVIIDLKFGKGVKVDATENHQLALYALGFMAKFDWLYAFTEVTLAVSQPRLHHYDEWTVSAKELYAFGEHIRKRFWLALEPDAPFGPDEKACKFCPAKATCPALADMALGLFEDITEPDALTEDRTVDVLSKAGLIRDYLSAVEDHATGVLLSGGEVKGYKLVEGRALRKWQGELEYVTRFLAVHGVDPYVRDVISPAAAEKLIDKQYKKELSSFMIKPAGRPTLVPVGDKRPAWTPQTADSMFADIDNPQSE